MKTESWTPDIDAERFVVRVRWERGPLGDPVELTKEVVLEPGDEQVEGSAR